MDPSKPFAPNGTPPALPPAADSEPSMLRALPGKAWEAMKRALPDLAEVYTEPLDPASGLPVSDRASLVLQSTRPWGEFLDLSTFNRPTLAETNKRVGHNIRTYFYNYFLLACVHVLFFAVGHLGTVLVVLLWAGLAWFLYGYHPEDLDVMGKFTLDDRGKMIVIVVSGIVAVFLGHFFTLVISLLVFLLIVVGIHSLIRDNTMGVMEPVV